MSVEPGNMGDIPETVADIMPDGDVMLILRGFASAPETRIGLRVSSHALSLASCVFKALCAASSTKAAESKDGAPSSTVISVLDDDSDSMYILTNILHLRNDRLPHHVTPEILHKLALLAHKYQCVVAAGRATVQWFDRLYDSKMPCDLWKVIEAAYLLNEATFFARFTTRWALEQPMYGREKPSHSHVETQILASVLDDRAVVAQLTLRTDLDILVDTCICSFSKQCSHYIDWAPGLSPEPDETPNERGAVECRVDPDAAAQYLGALRDADLFPAILWNTKRSIAENGKISSVGDIVKKLKDFREPSYNDVDKCEFCDDVKMKFIKELDGLKAKQQTRLWGLCLDCFGVGGLNVSECRYDHAKPRPLKSPQVQPPQSAQNASSAETSKVEGT